MSGQHRNTKRPPAPPPTPGPFCPAHRVGSMPHRCCSFRTSPGPHFTKGSPHGHSYSTSWCTLHLIRAWHTRGGLALGTLSAPPLSRPWPHATPPAHGHEAGGWYQPFCASSIQLPSSQDQKPEIPSFKKLKFTNCNKVRRRRKREPP